MKYILGILFLLSFVLSQDQVSKPVPVPTEKLFAAMKKSILKCISEEENISPALKNYVLENLQDGIKDTLILSKYQKTDMDRLTIRQCRRKAFLSNTRS